MSYFDTSVYDDVAAEARADWLAERPDPDYPGPEEFDHDWDYERKYRLENDTRWYEVEPPPDLG